MALPLKTYDSRLVSVTIGTATATGFADGTFITISRTSDAYTSVTGADGQTTRSRTHDNSSLITLTLNQSSDFNNELHEQQLLDETGNTGGFYFLLQYGAAGGGGEKAESTECYIMKPPDMEFGKESSNREWVILAHNLKMETVGLG